MFNKKQKLINWNLNQYIAVKLTDKGRYIHRQRYEELMKTIVSNGGKGFSYCLPKEDDDGFCKFQGWEFMQLFGPYMGLGTENVCELETFIEVSS